MSKQKKPKVTVKEPTQQWLTSDDKLFEKYEDAKKHETLLSYKCFLETDSSFYNGSLHVDGILDLIDFLKRHKTWLMPFLEDDRGE